MSKTAWGIAALVAMLAIVTATDAQVAGPKKVLTFKDRLALESKEKPATIDKLLKALGPAARDTLRAGEQIDIPGIGALRVVRIAEYKDLVNGIPTTIPARNFVEFVPAAELTTAANAPGAVPAKTVEAYEFRVNPNSAPGLKAEPRKVNRSRAGR